MVGDVKLLEGVKRRFTKRILGCKKLTYDNRLRELGLMRIEDRMERADLLQVFGIITGIDRIKFEDFFQRRESLTRGNVYKLYKRRFRTNKAKYVFQIEWLMSGTSCQITWLRWIL